VLYCVVICGLLRLHKIFPHHPIKDIYRTVMLPVVLYGSETWSHTLREESRLRVFENRVLSRIFGPKGDEVTGEWRKLHNEILIICTAYPILCGCSNREECDGRGM